MNRKKVHPTAIVHPGADIPDGVEIGPCSVVGEHVSIGSGTVESGVKQFKHRLTGPGMRWSRPGAQRMIVIRGAIMTEDFDALWDAA